MYVNASVCMSTQRRMENDCISFFKRFGDTTLLASPHEQTNLHETTLD